ncbi:MAG: hypothetical protein COW65_09990 [Cytophagales bacterium CG18_big_fil_WC_8_21_14_2_50_42_9]|nr:MAG: hypothetical protein COW65_09990 [Cytophagales bacterium CG18_big_fil_WC_8_21_14_2_50_42_9]
MILYQDSLLELDYDACTDVLYVNWPNLTEANIPYLNIAIDELLNAIKHYDIKRLLIDSGISHVDIPEEVYRPIVFSFINRLKSTRLHRMARVVPENTLREARLQGYTHQMQAENMFSYETGEFSSKDQALAWLKA